MVTYVLSVMSFVRASAAKIELSLGRTFPMIVLFEMVVHIFLSLEPL